MDVNRQEVTSGEIISEKVEVVWRIENYDVIRQSDAFVRNQKIHFQAGSSIGLASDWSAYLSLRGDRGTLRKNKRMIFFVKLEKVPAGVQKLVATYQIKIKKKTDEGDLVDFAVLASEGLQNFMDNHGRGKDTGIESAIRQEANATDLPLIDGCLVIHVEMTIVKLMDPPPQQSQQQIEALFKPRFSQKLQKDLAKLLSGPLADAEEEDAKILTQDQAEFNVNCNMLSARSPEFEKMFKKPKPEEAQTGTVVVTNVHLSSLTFTVLLQYIYSGTLHQDWSKEQVLPELVYAANKYKLRNLVDFLDQVVGHVCTKENAGRLFSLLGKLGMKTGQREVFNFIKSHMESFEDMAKFVAEGAREPGFSQMTPILSTNLANDLVCKKVEVTSGGLLSEKVKVVWRIENFATIWKSEFLNSQKISFEAGSSIGEANNWNCYLSLEDENGRAVGEKWLWVRFSGFRLLLDELSVSSTVKIKRNKDEDFAVRSTEGLHCFIQYLSQHGILGAIMGQDVWGHRFPIRQDAKVEDLPLIDGCLVIEAELTLLKLKSSLSLLQQYILFIENEVNETFTEKFQQDLAKFVTGQYAGATRDAKILSKDKVEFPVKASILSARSPVFEEVFQKSPTEAQTEIVIITDLSSKTVAALLQYIYTGTLHQDWSEEQVLIELIYAANEYKLQELIDFLNNGAGSVCTKENAGRLLRLLGKFGMKDGEWRVLYFLKGYMESLEDIAKFVEEGAQQPDILPQTVIISANQKDNSAKKMKLDADAES